MKKMIAALIQKTLMAAVLFLCLFCHTGPLPVMAAGAENSPISSVQPDLEQPGQWENTWLSNWMQILYNDQNGLPTGEANTVLQTSDGYLWIGGYGGLIRFDGKHFRNYSLEQSGLTSSGIRTLFEDAQGRLWVGSNDQGVFLYQDGAFVACEKDNGDLYNSVRCFAQDEKGTIYVGTSTGLARITDDNRLTGIQDAALDNQTIYTLSFDENETLWGTSGAGNAFAMKEENIVYWFEPAAFNEGDNYAVLAQGNTIYIGTSTSTLLRLTLTDDSYTPGSYQVERYSTGNIRTINSLYMTKNGQLWLAAGNGTAWFDQEMKLHLDVSLEQITSLNAITEDYEGGLWFASTRKGVFHLTKGKFSNANRTGELSGQAVNAVAKSGGLTYVATDNGLSIVNGRWEPVKNELTGLLEGTRVRHVASDSGGTVWISTYGDLALLRYSPETEEILSITEKDGLLSNQVRNTLELKNGDIAIASMKGLNIMRDTRIEASYGAEQGLENPVILSLLETQDGTLLAGSDGLGIYAISGGKVKNYGKEQGLTSGVVLRMREDSKAEGFWISAGSSLFFMDKNFNAREITNFHYGIGSIFDIHVMEDDVWLMKSSGLIIVPRNELLAHKPENVTQYGRESGLGANISANSWSCYEDGALYLSTVDGVYLLDRNTVISNDVPPKVAINDVMVQREGGEWLTFQGSSQLTVPSDAKRIKIQFSCLTFLSAPATVQYVLEGFDNDPIQVSSDEISEISYTNLRGGDYTFRLSAINSDGVESREETLLSIHKELGLFEHLWVWAAMAALLAVLAFLGARIAVDVKTRQLKRRQQEYRSITEQALRTIANTIDAKDKYTNGHSVRVAGYSREIARRMGLSGDEQENIYYMALLHDIGKIGIPDAILNKPGKLTEEEFEIMRNHTQIGSDILKDFTALPQIGQGALYHHENYDGSGYPVKIKEMDIPMVARIIRAADSFDAMATKRAYRDPMSKDYILSEFKRYSGIQFAPEIAAHILQMIEENFTLDNC